MVRRHFGRELWDRACRAVEHPDGLAHETVGYWTIKKLFFLCQYLAQTTQAMVGNEKFESVNYIDLFAASGVCVVEDDGHKKRYPGSALLAGACEKQFDNLFLVDSDADKIKALSTRIRQVNSLSTVVTWSEDANQIIDELCERIPDRSLNVAFIDPYSLDIEFDTVRRLASHRPLDLLILFADAMDIVRNVDKDYYPRHSDKLDNFLGNNANWRDRWDELQVRDGANARELFAMLYLEQLRSIGYEYHMMRSITRDGKPIYRLIYASKHQLGLKFWKIAESEDLGGDRSLWGV